MEKVASFNEKFGVAITRSVGTMWCAYAFAALALVSLPSVLQRHNLVDLVAWIAQTFLQLVLLAIIMVGQDVQARGVQQKIDETHDASLAEFELAKTARQEALEEIRELKAIALAVHASVVTSEGS
jgi:hypothetical protein